jgi:hypothetical protein
MYGKHNERKKCPVRPGGVYHLKGRVPYEQYQTEAQNQPTRARAVLRLIDQCEAPAKTVTITVLTTEAQDEQWLIRFIKGDHATTFDHPVYLAKYGDFTTEASKQAIPGDPEVMTPSAEDLTKARAKARERQTTPQLEGLARLRDEADTLRASMTKMKARNRIALAIKEIDKTVTELSIRSPATLPKVGCAARQASAAVEGEPRPCGTESDVSQPVCSGRDRRSARLWLPPPE